MNPLKIVSALQQIEEGKDMMRSSVELFWALFDEDSFEAHRGELRNDATASLARDIRDRGEAITAAEMSVLAVHKPDTFAERLPERLRELTERLTPPYQPDEPDDARSLFAAAHLQASRLALYLIRSAAGQGDRLFGYGGDDVSLLASDLKSLIDRSKVSPDGSVPLPAQPLRAVESLWARTDTALAVRDEDYARALTSFEEAHSLVSTLHDDYMPEEELGDVVFPWELSEDPWLPDWLSESDLRAQVIADWFESLKARRGTREWKAVAIACDKLSLLTDVLSRDSGEVVDGEERGWEWQAYWRRAAGWAEARLTPNDLLDLLQIKEYDAAEERLRAYFFDKPQWRSLSERAKEALISADKAWVSANSQRPIRGIRSIPNELRKAAEDTLDRYLWDPLTKWADAEEQSKLDFRELKKARERRAKLGRDPGLANYASILSDKGVVKYLQDHFAKGDADFIKSKVKKHLGVLKAARDPEEHGKGAPVRLSDLRDLYAEFMGLGRHKRAILPELVRILTQPPPK